MAKDYAKYITKKKSSIVPGWQVRLAFIVFLLLLLIAFGYGVFLYKINPKGLQDDFTNWVKHVKSLVHDSKVEPLPAKEIMTEKQQEEEIHFEFYTALPKMKVALPESETKKISSVMEEKLVQTPTSYRLQLGEFASQAEASEMRVSLLLAGIDAELIKVVRDEVTIYIVCQGPYVTFAAAKAAQQKLQKKGINSVLKKGE